MDNETVPGNVPLSEGLGHMLCCLRMIHAAYDADGADLSAWAGRAADMLEAMAEDRARFPDRPDFVGSMIDAHIKNLKTAARVNEEAWRRAQRHADDSAAGAARYEYVRTLSVPQFKALYTANIAGKGSFDELVDAAIEAASVT
jgi:hypothetical protein